MSAKTKHLGMAQAAHPNGSAARTVPRNQVSANASARARVGAGPPAAASAGARANASRRQRPRYQARSRLLGWKLILSLAALVVVGLLLGSAIIGEISTPTGKIAAAQTNHNFGDVPIGGGDITTKFPLTLDGDARAIDITST